MHKHDPDDDRRARMSECLRDLAMYLERTTCRWCEEPYELCPRDCGNCRDVPHANAYAALGRAKEFR